MSHIMIPRDILPEDGRFGSGPSKIRTEQMGALNRGARTLLGTSHRQTPVKHVISSIREGLIEFLHLPDGYEVALGNGGASLFWDMACSSLIIRKAACGVYGSFSAKFAQSIVSTPFLLDPVIFESPAGTFILPEYTDKADAYCWAHNETSTGVSAPVTRVEGSQGEGALMLVDGTSAAGSLPIDISQTDVYFFSPQKAFGSDGGIWFAIVSPAAIERAFTIESNTNLEGAIRWIPPLLSLKHAVEYSRKDQTLNTPAIATLAMMDEQLKWFNGNGGQAWAHARCTKSASTLYQWAEESDYARPFVEDRLARSNAVVTVELDPSIKAEQVANCLQDNGIVDTLGYRKLGRNQLRLGVFPSVEPSDVVKLTNCIDYVVDQMHH